MTKHICNNCDHLAHHGKLCQGWNGDEPCGCCKVAERKEQPS